MAQPRVFGLNKINISQAGGGADNNASSQSNAGAYALPVQLIELQEDLDHTLIIPDQSNHAYTVVDTGAFNISTNNEPCINWQNDTAGQQLILRGSGLLSTGGTITETQVINATGSVANAGGVEGLTITRSAGTTNFEGVPSNRLGGFGRPCYSLTVTADMVWIVDPGLGTPDADGGSATARGTLSVSGSTNFTQTIGCEDSFGNGGGCGVIGLRFRGPAYTNQTGWFAGGRFHLAGNAQEIARYPQLAVGDVVTVCNRNTNQSAGITAFGATAVTRYTFTATNNSTLTVSVGGVALAPGASATIANNTTNATISFQVTRPARLDYDYTFTGTDNQTITNADGAQGIDLRRQRIDIAGANNNGTTSVDDIGGINVAVTAGGTFSGPVGSNVDLGNPYTVQAQDAFLTLGGFHEGDSQNSTNRVGVSINGVETVYTSVGMGSFAGLTARGPAWVNGDSYPGRNAQNVASLPQLATGDIINVRPITYRNINNRARRRSVFNQTRYGITFTNNNPYAVTLTAGSTGGARTLAANGGAANVQTGDTTNQSWVVASPFINDSGSGSAYAGGFDVTVTGTTTPGGLTVRTLNLQNASAGNSGVVFGQADRTEVASYRITADTSFARITYANNSGHAGIVNDAARGPAWQAGDAGLGLTAAQVAALPQRAAGQFVSGSETNGGSRNARLTGSAVRGPDVTTHDISFTNNNNAATTIAAASTGGARTIASGATVQVADDAASNNWVLAFSSTTRYDYFVDNHGPAVATFTVNGNEVSVPVTAEDTEVQLIDDGVNAAQGFTWSTPAINADGHPLAPGSQAIIGPNITRTANGTVTAGVDFTDFTGQYSRTS